MKKSKQLYKYKVVFTKKNSNFFIRLFFKSYTTELEFDKPQLLTDASTKFNIQTVIEGYVQSKIHIVSIELVN